MHLHLFPFILSFQTLVNFIHDIKSLLKISSSFLNWSACTHVTTGLKLYHLSYIYIYIYCLNQVKQELNFHDKDTQFYRFKDSEFGLNLITNEKDSEDELQECLSLLSQLGPDALLTMILRKWSVDCMWC